MLKLRLQVHVISDTGPVCDLSPAEQNPAVSPYTIIEPPSPASPSKGTELNLAPAAADETRLFMHAAGVHVGGAMSNTYQYATDDYSTLQPSPGRDEEEDACATCLCFAPTTTNANANGARGRAMGSSSNGSSASQRLFPLVELTETRSSARRPQDDDEDDGQLSRHAKQADERACKASDGRSCDARSSVQHLPARPEDRLHMWHQRRLLRLRAFSAWASILRMPPGEVEDYDIVIENALFHVRRLSNVARRLMMRCVRQRDLALQRSWFSSWRAVTRDAVAASARRAGKDGSGSSMLTSSCATSRWRIGAWLRRGRERRVMLRAVWAWRLDVQMERMKTETEKTLIRNRVPRCSEELTVVGHEVKDALHAARTLSTHNALPPTLFSLVAGRNSSSISSPSNEDHRTKNTCVSRMRSPDNLDPRRARVVQDKLSGSGAPACTTSLTASSRRKCAGPFSFAPLVRAPPSAGPTTSSAEHEPPNVTRSGFATPKHEKNEQNLRNYLTPNSSRSSGRMTSCGRALADGAPEHDAFAQHLDTTGNANAMSSGCSRRPIQAYPLRKDGGRASAAASRAGSLSARAPPPPPGGPRPPHAATRRTPSHHLPPKQADRNSSTRGRGPGVVGVPAPQTSRKPPLDQRRPGKPSLHPVVGPPRGAASASVSGVATPVLMRGVSRTLGARTATTSSSTPRNSNAARRINYDHTHVEDHAPPMKTSCEEQAAACHSSAKSSASTCSPLTSSRTTSMQDLNWTARTSMPDSTKSSRPSLPDASSTNTTRVVGGACCLSSQEKDAGSDGAGGIGVDSQHDKDMNRLKNLSSNVISRGPAAPATSSHALPIEPPSGASTPGPPSPIGARIERASVERREVSHSTLAEELKLADGFGCPRFLGPFTVGESRNDVDMDLPAETDEQSESARLSGLPKANVAPVSCTDHKKALTSKDENCPEPEQRLHWA